VEIPPVVLGGTYRGVGGSRALASVSADFAFQRVRLFVEETEADTRLSEMSGWCMAGPGAVAVATVCKTFKLVACNSEAFKSEQTHTLIKRCTLDAFISSTFRRSASLPSSRR
jgi:hypothetical protein